MSTKQKMTWAALLWLFPLAAFAQLQLTGHVADNTGLEIIGATVQIQGTGVGSITDFDGNFTLQSAANEGTLTVSYVGYKTENFKFDKNTTTFKVTLKEDTETLEEVVVVGYGVQRKSDLTGSVASVKMSDAVKNTPVSNVSEALQGRLSGVSVVQSSGQPGAENTIRVRGTNSLLGDSGPLVVIDGIIGGSLSALNPADIASVEVLKDASATAVYGSRGANGVILITTKTPETGTMSVTYSGYANMKTPYTLPSVMSAGEFAELANAYGEEFYGTTNRYYTNDEVAAFKNGKGGYDYMDNVFRGVAIEHTHELSVSGGNDKIKFLLSGSYNNNQGIVYNSSSQRANYRLKVDANIKKWLKMGANLWGSWSTSKGPRFSQYNNLLISTLTFPTTIAPQDENGDYNNMNLTGPQYNPMLFINEINRKGYNNDNRIQAYVDATILPGLSFRMTHSFNFANSNVRNTYGKGSYEYYQTYASTTAAIATMSATTTWVNSNVLSYVKEFNRNHRLNATAVFEQQQTDYLYLKTEGIGLTSTDVGASNVALADETKGSSQATTATMMSFMLRANYALMNRYMITASWRYDGSSRLAYKNRWQQFPAVALAWNIKEEGFMQDVDNLDQLKLRLGYGVTGNQAVPLYSAYTKINASRDAENNLTLITQSLGNENLKWEKNTQYNAGLDISTLGSRLTFNLDAYYKLSTDVLLDVDSELYTGFSSRTENAATISNKGLELTITGLPVRRKNFQWNSTVVLSTNYGKIEDLAQGKEYTTISGKYEATYFRFIKGQPISTLWGYKCLGVWTTDEIAALKQKMGDTEFGKMNITAGSYKYEDLDGVPGITSADAQIIGNGQPKFNWSWDNTFTYKNFDFGLFLIGVHGFDIYNYTRAAQLGAASVNTTAITPTSEWADRWQAGTNENTNIAGFVSPNNNQIPSSNFVEKGGFVKVKSITLGYSLPQDLLQKARISNVRIYASVQNPFLITNYSGIDPEVSLKNPLLSGIDWGYYPNGRNYKIGLNFQF